MDKIKLIFLGGQDELYKNMCAIEINNDIFVIGAGFKTPDKTNPGIDFIIPRYDYLLANKEKVKGYFLTHGFDSVFGALPFIYEKVPAPIYCTRVTNDFLKGFCVHNKLNYEKLPITIVKTDEDLLLANRKISFFGVTSNFAESVGISIDTDQGNIVYISNAVAHNDFEKGFVFDKQKIAKVCEKKTLVLLLDALNADKTGYCSPNYSLLKILNPDVFEKEGRIFLAVDQLNLFNVIQCLNTAVENGRKIICYDENSSELVNTLNSEGFLNIKNDSLATIEDVNRLRPREVLIFMTGFAKKLNLKISLLASRKNDEKIVFIKDSDTFIYGSHITQEIETIATDTINELYKTGCNIIKPGKQYSRMHACEEDIKYLIAMFKPKYLVPVTAQFVKLLACAMVALNMNIGLNHNNVFIVDNGNIIEFEAGFGKLLPNKVVAGDVFVDGKGIGDVRSEVLEERNKLSDEGVVVLGLTISKSKHEIVAGPDVQARGLVFLKDNEGLIREITRLFVTSINNELAKENYSIAYMEQTTKDICFKAIKRAINKSPVIIPIIVEIN